MVIHVVSAGDTIQSVANRYNIPEFVLRTLNDLEYTSNLVVGQALLILTPSGHTTMDSYTIYCLLIGRLLAESDESRKRIAVIYSY